MRGKEKNMDHALNLVISGIIVSVTTQIASDCTCGFPSKTKVLWGVGILATAVIFSVFECGAYFLKEDEYQETTTFKMPKFQKVKIRERIENILFEEVED